MGSRIGLVNLINKYFAGKKIGLSLHLDGYPGDPLSLLKGKIIYSQNQPSDVLIKEEITNSKNPRLIILITSDRNLMNYARACSCTVIKSEDFYILVEQSQIKNEEEQIIKQLEKERGEFEKLFGQ
jgi:hypothetical protein